MISTTKTNYCFLCILVLCFRFHICSSKDNITTGEAIRDETDYLESPGKMFQMGFFSPQTGSKRRYVGIWYVMDPTTVVWVANRDAPVLDSSGVLTIAEDGEVKVLDKDQKIYFKTETGAGGASQMALKLLDSGNAVLIDILSGSRKWQSFLHPTDTFLPGMKMDLNLKLTSWKSADDPSTGSFVFQYEDTTQYAIMKSEGIKPHWKSGSGSLRNFDPKPLFPNAYELLSNSTKRSNITIGCKLNPNTPDNSSRIPYEKSCPKDSLLYARLLMNYTGNIQYYSWVELDKQWSLDWQAPKDNCSINDVCGKFGMCSLSNNNATCTCLQGFERVASEDSSAGCKQIIDKCDQNDHFINLAMINVENPVSLPVPLNNELDCKNKCLQSCECKAYSYTPAIDEQAWSGRPTGTNRCWIWISEVNDLRSDGTKSISIRVSKAVDGYLNPVEDSPLDNSSSFITKTHILIFAFTILVILLLCSTGYIYYKRRVTREEGRNSKLQAENNEKWAIDLLDLGHSGEENTEGIGIPFFQFEDIVIATNNFADANKLGQGGFGPVYKGTLPSGLEVAIKRLSDLSGQGLEEFRNEVTLIAKLQHRNLVRLLGYCMKGNEKLLLYEYMPNKSLDAFIFDRTPSITLDWPKRREIIIGIARGLLYLHQDSRLRIIHRDMKTSNILLDDELNPKISDFGLAKIVQGRDMEASTNRVIGTYGYMAPEYALDGLFSIKSDVFSFGVVVLEIISGKKNIGSTQSQQNISLLGYAWNLWNEDMPFELIDQKLLKSSNSSEVLKCINIGLLCVQEDPGERPTMANVVSMLASDITSLPIPKQPAFVARKTMSSSSSSSYKPDQSQTNNSITISTLQEGR